MISIVIVTYNDAKFLRKQLDSLLCQTTQDLGLVISDDCSTDDTWQVFENYAKNDYRIRIVKNEKNLGFKDSFLDNL